MAKKQVVPTGPLWSHPDFSLLKLDHKKYKSNLHGALMYAHYELSAKRLKDEVLTFLKKSEDTSLVFTCSKVNEKRLFSIGKYIYILNNGGELEAELQKKIVSSLHSIVREESHRELPKNIEPSKDDIRESVFPVICEIEQWLEQFFRTKKIRNAHDFVKLFKSASIQQEYISIVKSAFNTTLKELLSVVRGADEQLNEGYNHLSVRDIKKCIIMIRNIDVAHEIVS